MGTRFLLAETRLNCSRPGWSAQLVRAENNIRAKDEVVAYNDSVLGEATITAISEPIVVRVDLVAEFVGPVWDQGTVGTGSIDFILDLTEGDGILRCCGANEDAFDGAVLHVPEPSAQSALLTGLAVLALASRRRRHNVTTPRSRGQNHI